MASIRKRVRAGGGNSWGVLFTLEGGRQTSVTFTDEHVTTAEMKRQAEAFKTLVESAGGRRALEVSGLKDSSRARPSGPTVDEYLKAYIDGLTGKTKATLWDYRNYLKNDIKPVLGDIPLADLSSDDIARWIKAMETKGRKTKNGQWAPVSGKTIANKHGFLSGALNAAVKCRPPLIPFNPAAGASLPKTERADMVLLTRADYERILAEIPDYWKPLVEFLVASGCRWGEASALRPADVNQDAGTVRIHRAWKRTYQVGGYELGPPKTKRSRRTISVAKSVLDKLDYSGDWLFTNSGRGNQGADGPVRSPSFRENVWRPAVERAAVNTTPRLHDLRHTHASWLIQAGKPLPVISRRMGHESIQVTVDVYGHLDRSDDIAAAEVFGE